MGLGKTFITTVFRILVILAALLELDKQNVSAERENISGEGVIDRVDQELEEVNNMEEIKAIQSENEDDNFIGDMRDEKLSMRQIHKSIEELINITEPDPREIEKQKNVTEQLETYLKAKTPFKISRISVVGSLSQGTSLRGVEAVDLAVFIEDVPEYNHTQWLPAVIYSIKIVLKQRTDVPSGSVLQLCSNFSTTSISLTCTCDDVNIKIFPTNDWKQRGGYPRLYKICLTRTKEQLKYYHVAACERQTEFIFNQTVKCKELIRAVKYWRNGILWRTSSRPGDYLLSLLVVAAYGVVRSNYNESQPVIPHKEVFQELVKMVNETNLDISWSRYYLPSQYRSAFAVPFEYPIVQDPAIPTNNVAETGLGNWTQFRDEFSKFAKQVIMAG